MRDSKSKVHLVQPHRDHVFALTLMCLGLIMQSLNSIQNEKSYIEIDTYITYSPPWMPSLIRNIKRSFIKVVMGLGKELR